LVLSQLSKKALSKTFKAGSCGSVFLMQMTPTTMQISVTSFFADFGK
jgi:transcription elongation factor Elf1